MERELRNPLVRQRIMALLGGFTDPDYQFRTWLNPEWQWGYGHAFSDDVNDLFDAIGEDDTSLDLGVGDVFVHEDEARRVRQFLSALDSLLDRAGNREDDGSVALVLAHADWPELVGLAASTRAAMSSVDAPARRRALSAHTKTYGFEVADVRLAYPDATDSRDRDWLAARAVVRGSVGRFQHDVFFRKSDVGAFADQVRAFQRGSVEQASLDPIEPYFQMCLAMVDGYPTLSVEVAERAQFTEFKSLVRLRLSPEQTDALAADLERLAGRFPATRER